MKKYSKITIGSNRSFGIVFFIIFFLISLYPTLNNENINLYFLSISIVFLILGLLNSKLLNPLNKLWFKFGILLGNLISPIIMGLVYFFVITPIAMLLKIFNKDVLNLKQNKKNTYWIDKIKSESTMKDQF
tara:strand:+ start:54 stop:446 length:393 start_codon:yes stop_codon:yes gene_type:complete